MTPLEFCEIPKPWALGRKYGHHPCPAYQHVREMPAFQHISDLELSTAVVRAERWSPSSGYSWVSSPARVSLEILIEEVAVNFGLFCCDCRKPVRQPDDFHGRRGGYYYEPRTTYRCDPCLAVSAVASERREAKDRLARKVFAAHQEAQRAAREAADCEYRERRERDRSARITGKLEREAAYQLVKKLGLLEAR